MDINLARTFLEIAASGSLQRASEQLHITQTAVGARLRTLEGLLGRQLFIRNKAGAALTPAGEQFARYATGLVQLWERARQHVAVPPGRHAVVNIGCEVSLWDPLLLNWLLNMRKLAPHLAIRTEIGFPDNLLQRVADGVLDIAVVYAPRQTPGLRIELLIEEKLVLVTTAKRTRAPKPADYVYVDWGPEFAAQHAMAFPELTNAALTAGLGLLGLGYGCFMAVDQALATQVLPDSHSRGKDLGIMNIATAVPQAFAPLLGAFVVAAVGGFTGLFICSAIAATLGGLAILPIKSVR